MVQPFIRGCEHYHSYLKTRSSLSSKMDCSSNWKKLDFIQITGSYTIKTSCRQSYIGLYKKHDDTKTTGSYDGCSVSKETIWKHVHSSSTRIADLLIGQQTKKEPSLGKQSPTLSVGIIHRIMTKQIRALCYGFDIYRVYDVHIMGSWS